MSAVNTIIVEMFYNWSKACNYAKSICQLVKNPRIFSRGRYPSNIDHFAALLHRRILGICRKSANRGPHQSCKFRSKSLFIFPASSIFHYFPMRSLFQKPLRSMFLFFCWGHFFVFQRSQYLFFQAGQSFISQQSHYFNAI